MNYLRFVHIQLNRNLYVHTDDEEVISFGVVSLYTNVPVVEAIDVCSDLLYSGNHKKPPVDKKTFKELLTVCSHNVIMLTHNGLYRQVDGLAMGSPPAPMLANGWLSTYDPVIKGNASLYSRYMDDVLRNIKRDAINATLLQINSLHPSLKFTIEKEAEDGSIAFLDMKIIHEGKNLVSTWYTKPTDTNLIMNFYALAPTNYKRSVVSGMLHRIFRLCSSYHTLHESLQKAKDILRKNQYPESFVDPIFKNTLNKCLQNAVQQMEDEEEEKKMLFVEYRGTISDQFKNSVSRLDIPCRVIFTLKKLKQVLPSLKPSTDKSLKSGVVYQITCPRCMSRYVGQTRRHLLTRIKEHGRPKAPVSMHMESYQHKLSMDDVTILASKSKSADHLMTLEALFIEQLHPKLNTNDEYKSRSLFIKF